MTLKPIRSTAAVLCGLALFAVMSLELSQTVPEAPVQPAALPATSPAPLAEADPVVEAAPVVPAAPALSISASPVRAQAAAGMPFLPDGEKKGVETFQNYLRDIWSQGEFKRWNDTRANVYFANAPRPVRLYQTNKTGRTWYYITGIAKNGEPEIAKVTYPLGDAPVVEAKSVPVDLKLVDAESLETFVPRGGYVGNDDRALPFPHRSLVTDQVPKVSIPYAAWLYAKGATWEANRVLAWVYRRFPNEPAMREKLVAYVKDKHKFPAAEELQLLELGNNGTEAARYELVPASQVEARTKAFEDWAKEELDLLVKIGQSAMALTGPYRGLGFDLARESLIIGVSTFGGSKAEAEHRKKYQEAVKKFEAAAKAKNVKAETDKVAKTVEGNIHYLIERGLKGRFDAAKAEFDAAEELRRKADQEGDPQKKRQARLSAVASYEKLVGPMPKHAQGKLQARHSDADLAKVVDPNAGYVYFYLGIVHMDLSDPRDSSYREVSHESHISAALILFEKALRYYPGHVDLRLRMAKCRLSLKQYGESRKLLEELDKEAKAEKNQPMIEEIEKWFRIVDQASTRR